MGLRYFIEALFYFILLFIFQREISEINVVMRETGSKIMMYQGISSALNARGAPIYGLDYFEDPAANMMLMQ